MRKTRDIASGTGFGSGIKLGEVDATPRHAGFTHHMPANVM